MTAAPGTLQVGLGGEFLDVAARVLEEAVPRDGSFCIPERYLTSRDLSDKVAHTFAWQNAPARCRAAEPALVEYHLWTLLGSLRSEDVWEAIFRVAVNAESQAIVELPDVFQEPDLVGEEQVNASADPATLATATAEGKRRLIKASTEFVRRVEQRLERDTQAIAGVLSSACCAKRTARSVARRRLPHPRKSQPRSGRWIWNFVASWRK